MGIFSAIMCLTGIFTLFTILIYINFQKGKAIVIVMFLLVIVGSGLITFKCFKSVFYKKKTIPTIKTTNLFLTEMSTQPVIEDVSKQETILTIDPIKVNTLQQEAPKEILNNMKTSTPTEIPIQPLIEDVPEQETIQTTDPIKVNTLQQEAPKEILNSMKTSIPTEIPIQPIVRKSPKQETISITITNSIKVNIIQQGMPKEVLNSMKALALYTNQQVINDMKIIDDSLSIMEKTSDIDTFLSRFDTAMRCSLTLQQAKKAGIPIALPDDFTKSLMDAKNEELVKVLYRSFKKEINEINKLKTKQGKLNRINKYEEKLKGLYKSVFEFVADNAYNDIIQKLKLLKNSLN